MIPPDILKAVRKAKRAHRKQGLRLEAIEAALEQRFPVSVPAHVANEWPGAMPLPAAPAGTSPRDIMGGLP